MDHYKITSGDLAALVGRLQFAVRSAFGSEWEVGSYTDKAGAVVTVACCRTPGVTTDIPVSEITRLVASESRSIRWSVTHAHSHESDQPVLSFLVRKHEMDETV